MRPCAIAAGFGSDLLRDVSGKEIRLTRIEAGAIKHVRQSLEDVAIATEAVANEPKLSRNKTIKAIFEKGRRIQCILAARLGCFLEKLVDNEIVTAEVAKETLESARAELPLSSSPAPEPRTKTYNPVAKAKACADHAVHLLEVHAPNSTEAISAIKHGSSKITITPAQKPRGSEPQNSLNQIRV